MSASLITIDGVLKTHYLRVIRDRLIEDEAAVSRMLAWWRADRKRVAIERWERTGALRGL